MNEGAERLRFAMVGEGGRMLMLAGGSFLAGDTYKFTSSVRKSGADQRRYPGEGNRLARRKSRAVGGRTAP